jgi:hypothetical protein
VLPANRNIAFAFLNFIYNFCLNELTSVKWKPYNSSLPKLHKVADKSLARPTSRFFYSKNISFEVSLVIYINSTNIPPIMIINRVYENQNFLSL